MKASIIPLAIALGALLCVCGCKKEQPVLFCEGVTPEGKTVKCGGKFTTGELSLVVKAREAFQVDKLTVSIIEKTKYKEVPERSMVLEVKPDATTAVATVSFYNEGLYRVEVVGRENRSIGSAEITVVDTY